MRIRLLTVVAIAGSVVAAPSVAGERGVRWVAFIQAEEEFAFLGSLEAVRSNGSGARTLIGGGVSSADLGPDEFVYAVRGEPPRSELLQMPVRRGDPDTVAPGGENVIFDAVTAARNGAIAFERFVPPKPIEPPPYLAPAVETLRETNVPVLVPPGQPSGTDAVVADATSEDFELRFTNDPGQELSHAEQVNKFIDGEFGEEPPPLGSVPVEVRDTEGAFSCGASACFLQWSERGATYTVGEFGSPEEAVAFAESLEPIEDILGPFWRDPTGVSLPQVVVRTADGEQRTIERVREFCECGYRPVDWSPDGERVLVILGSEGFFTQLLEYSADGSGGPTTVFESEAEIVVDAGYGPDGLLVLITGEGGPPGELRNVGGETILDDVFAFDIQGNVLAYVNASHEVVVRDLRDGRERVVGEGAIDVSLSPDLVRAIPKPGTPPEEDEGLPIGLIAGIGGGAAALVGLALYLGLRLGRRRV